MDSDILSDESPEPVTARMRRWGALVLDALLPPICLACRAPVETPGQLCSSCWPAITFIADPHCACCGLPFEFQTPRDTQCAACLGDPPAYDRARAAMVYDDESRSLILAFKHGDRLESAKPLAAWMARAGVPLMAGDPLLVPVPLHRRRLLHRRYNQSALLAQALAQDTGLDWDPLVLQRVKQTRSQHGLSAGGRRRNVAGAFMVAPARAGRVAGRAILLIDDVLTTGATVEACARVLRKAGATSVDVLTVARTPQARHIA
ncbi:MAG: double zinc ribbon domain-containing protein [Alphaproteobacteria bacterium]